MKLGQLVQIKCDEFGAGGAIGYIVDKDGGWGPCHYYKYGVVLINNDGKVHYFYKNRLRKTYQCKCCPVCGRAN